MKLVEDPHRAGKYCLAFQATRSSYRFRYFHDAFSFTRKSTEIDILRNKRRRSQVFPNLGLRTHQIRFRQPNIYPCKVTFSKVSAYSSSHQLWCKLHQASSWSLSLLEAICGHPGLGQKRKASKDQEVLQIWWGTQSEEICNQQHRTAEPLAHSWNPLCENCSLQQESVWWWDLQVGVYAIGGTLRIGVNVPKKRARFFERMSTTSV